MSLPMQKITLRARAIACGFGTSSKGNTQIAVQCEIVDDDNYAGESIAWIGHFTDKTSARTIESLQHMGWKGDDLAELEDLDRDHCAEKLPEVVEIACEPEEYEGVPQLRVRWVNRPGFGKFTFKEPLAGSALKSFAAQMKATVRSVRGGQSAPAKSNGGSSRPATPHPNAPGGTDDTPF